MPNKYLKNMAFLAATYCAGKRTAASAKKEVEGQQMERWNSPFIPK